MEQPGRFGPFLLFQETGSNRYRSCYRAGVTRGRAVERIVRLEIFDRPDFEATELLSRIEASSRIQAALEDPHIASGAGLGQVEETPYAAYDFELGTTLAAFLRAARERGFPIPLDQALFVAERIALALAAAFRVEQEEEPILHSFLTPETVLLSNVGEVKVSGFETSPSLRLRLHGEGDWAPYLSPQCRAGQPPHPQDDVFSLGSLLFELVTGEPLPPESAELDTVIVRATGEPAAQGLRELLRRSLAEPARRIPHVLDWQRSLGTLILDGEYNPTTFNLAFLLHTLLREPLERGIESLEREKRYVLPQAAGPLEPTEEGAAGGHQEIDTEATVPAAGPELDLAEVAAGPDPPPPPSASTRDSKPFWLGFAISAITASAILGSVLVWGKQSKGAAPERLEPELAATTRQANPWPPRLERETPGEPESATEPDAKPALVLTEVVQGQLGGAPGIDEIERTLAERTAEIERNLAAEYEKKLEALRSEMLALRGLERRGSEALVESAQATTRAEPSATKRVESDPVETMVPDEVSRAERGAPNPVRATVDSGFEPESNEVETGPASAPGGDYAQPSAPESSEASSKRVPFARSSTLPAPGTDPAKVGSAPVLTEPGQARVRPDPEPDPASEPSPTAAEIPARLLRLKPPLYPPAAKRLGLSATARVHVVISPEGDVLEAKIVGPELGNGFDRAALVAVRRSQWKPATRGGEAVESTSLVTLQFQP